jgi:hypothetical protein
MFHGVSIGGLENFVLATIIKERFVQWEVEFSDAIHCRQSED